MIHFFFFFFFFTSSNYEPEHITVQDVIMHMVGSHLSLCIITSYARTCCHTTWHSCDNVMCHTRFGYFLAVFRMNLCFSPNRVNCSEFCTNAYSILGALIISEGGLTDLGALCAARLRCMRINMLQIWYLSDVIMHISAKLFQQPYALWNITSCA